MKRMKSLWMAATMAIMILLPCSLNSQQLDIDRNLIVINSILKDKGYSTLFTSEGIISFKKDSVEMHISLRHNTSKLLTIKISQYISFSDKIDSGIVDSFNEKYNYATVKLLKDIDRVEIRSEMLCCRIDDMKTILPFAITNIEKAAKMLYKESDMIKPENRNADTVSSINDSILESQLKQYAQ